MHPEPKGCSDGCERKPNYFGNHNDDENICIEDEGSKTGTGCPTIEYSLCFGCFLSFQSSYREVFYHFLTAQETRIPKLTLLSSLRQKLIKLQSKTWGKLDLDII